MINGQPLTLAERREVETAIMQNQAMVSNGCRIISPTEDGVIVIKMLRNCIPVLEKEHQRSITLKTLHHELGK